MQNQQNLDTKTALKSVMLYISISITSLVFLTAISISIAIDTNQKKVEKEYEKQVQRSIDHVIKHFANDYSFRVQSMAKHMNISEYILNDDREGLYKFLKVKYDLMRQESPYIKVLHIHKADGSSFLRVHKPNYFGDKVANKRAMLKAIHTTHKAIVGYETGLYTNVYRIIEPIFDTNKKYIGAIEIGINPNFIVNAVHDINGFNGAVFIKENELQLHSISNTLIIDGYRLQSTLQEGMQKIVTAFKSLNKFESNIKIKIEGVNYLTHLVILKNYKNQESVKIVFFQKLTHENPFFDTLHYFIYMLILTVLILSIWLIYIRLSRFNLHVTKIYKTQIDKLKESEKTIIDSKRYMENIFKAVPNMLISTNGSEIENANSAMLDFFAYNTLEDFHKEHKCICEYFLEEKDTLHTQMGSMDWLEYIIYFKDKIHKIAMKRDSQIHHFTVSATKLKYDEQDRYIVVFSDVTQLEEISQRLEYATNGANDGLWDWNLLTNEVYFSPRWKEMLGYRDHELKNEFDTWKSRVHPDDLERAIEGISRTHKEPNIPYEGVHRLRHKDGHWVWILDRGQTIFDNENNPIRMVGFHSDITKEHEAKEKLIEEQKRSSELSEVMIAQSRHAAMGEMISMIAHQWRQPISVIAMDANNILADIELEMIDEETLKSGSEDIIKQTQELSKTIDDFRNFFRPEKESEEIKLLNIVNDSLGIISKSLENNDVEIDLHVDKNLVINTYSRELMQVLVNLMKNAKEVLVEKEIEFKKIWVSSESTGEYLTLRVTDNAGGIDEKIMGRIFDPYFTTKGEKNGTGLGLYMSKTIIEQHLGGILKAYNSQDGAVFEIQLPQDLKILGEHNES